MIFNLFKSKPTLKELIPEGFVDIHSHILPGIDDGAQNIQESMFLISEMKKIGFRSIFGTPHTYRGVYNNTRKTIDESFKKIQNIKNDIKLSYASEYMLDESIMQQIENKSLLTFDGKHVLVEMSYSGSTLNLHDIIFHLRVNDYIPILAHPERYLFLHDNFRQYFKLKKHGCKFQLNLLSATNYYGKKVCKIVDKLYKNNLIDFTGSDIHNIRHINAFCEKIVISEVDKFEASLEANNIFSLIKNNI